MDNDRIEARGKTDPSLTRGARRVSRRSFPAYSQPLTPRGVMTDTEGKPDFVMLRRGERPSARQHSKPRISDSSFECTNNTSMIQKPSLMECLMYNATGFALSYSRDAPRIILRPNLCERFFGAVWCKDRWGAISKVSEKKLTRVK